VELPELAPHPAENGAVSRFTRGRLAVGVRGLGAAVPSRRVGNDVVAARLGVEEEWIVRRTGIHGRRHVEEGEGVADLGLRAARAALDRAALDPAELDLVLVATVAADQITPSAAPLIAHELGARGAGAIDVGAACSGSLSALMLAGGMLESGRARHVLLVGVEVLSRFIDRDDRATAILFADGAGALVLSAGAGGWLGPVILRSDGSLRDLIVIPHGGCIELQGHETFKAAVNNMSSASVDAITAAGCELSDIDLFVFHQANGRILTAVAERLALPEERVLDCIAELGNTSAASLPLALAHAQERGRLAPGSRVLLSALGAGLTWGAAVLEWP
jgi:3-oxoacyl-[acyl-carrier-protein] synthase-3